MRHGSSRSLSPAGLIFLSALFSILGAWPGAQAQIIADPGAPAGQQPTILNTANGVPQVNIQTPSGAGVSRNSYSQFDVQGQGAILNNARTDTQTQLGGWIQGNPWLANGSARVILNEVNSSNPSLLQGYVEVAGDRAQVVIANPAGVTCSGCGFINANRATLTTGTPILNGGSLDGYRVQGGTVNIDGAGLDTRDTDYTDIIAHAVQINAGVWAKELRITAGANQVDAAHGQITPITGKGAAPAFGLDVAQLGGMYAGKIHLKVTGSGVGVRNAGSIGAGSGGFVVTADGRIVNSGRIRSSGAIAVTTHADTENTGSLYAEGNTTVTATTQINNANGTIVTEQKLDLQAAGLDNSHGDIQSGGDAQLMAGAGSIDNSGGLLHSVGTLTVRAGSVNNANNQTSDVGIQAHAIDIAANTLNNENAAIQSDDGLRITLSDNLNNGNGLIAAGGDLNLALSTDFTNNGKIAANNDLTITIAQHLDNRSDLLAGNRFTLNAADFDNAAGAETSGKTVSLSITDTLANRGLIDGENTHIVAGSLHNTSSGQIFGTHLALETASLSNDAENGRAGSIAARNRLDLGVGTITNKDGALLYSDGDLSLGGQLDDALHAFGNAARLINQGATIEAQGDLTLVVSDLQNRNAGLETEQVADAPHNQDQVTPLGSSQRFAKENCSGIGGGQDKNSCSGYGGEFEDYTLYKLSVTTSHTEVTSSQPGKILSARDLRIEADDLLNKDSHVIAGGTLQVTTTNLSNEASKGQDVTTLTGTTQFTHVDSCGSFGRSHCRRWDSEYAYNATELGPEYDLPTLAFEQNTTPNGSGTDVPGLSADSGPAGQISLTLPTSSLYRISADNPNSPLVETDSRFTDRHAWLGSDYMLSVLAADPATTQMRLGDGFYEQQLIRDQVAQLTGRRFLEGYGNDEAQFQALMDNGIAYAQEWNLIPGIALTGEQMAQLTSDLVWLVEKDIVLADGSHQKVLAPQLYARVGDGDLSSSGALLSGRSVDLNLSGDLINSGTLAATESLFLEANNIRNQGGTLQARQLDLLAQGDILGSGGRIEGTERLWLEAGGDISLGSSTTTQTGANGSRTGLLSVASLSAGIDGLTLTAGGDIDLNALQATSSGGIDISADNDIRLGTLTTGHSLNVEWNSTNYRRETFSQEQGTTLQAQGDIQLQAGHDLTARAAQVTSSQGVIQATAGNDLQLTAGQNSQSLDEAHQRTEKGLLSSKTTTTRDTRGQTQAQATTFSATAIALQAGNDIRLTGSNAVADGEAQLQAGNGITLEAATDTLNESHSRDEQKSGLFSNGGLSLTLGKQQQTSTTQTTATQAAGSTLGSTGGDIGLQAQEGYRQSGSDLIAAQGDITIDAGKIQIEAARETRQTTTQTQFQQSGLTLSVTNPVISAVQTAQQMSQAAGNTDDGRMQVLAAAATGLAAKNAYDAVQAGQSVTDGNLADQRGGVNVSLSLGKSQSESTTTQSSDTAKGSSLAAGGDITISASGSAEGEGDLLIQGSSLQAGNAIQLNATNQIDLQAARNTARLQGSSNNSSASLGIGVGLGQGGAGASLTLSASQGKGSSGGTDLTWTNTQLTAGNSLDLSSGGDTTLQGATASAGQITAHVGGNLQIESLQDQSSYNSREQNLGGSLSVPLTPGGGFGASLNASRSQIDSTYASVTQQSGLQAGDQGFQIEVQGNTDLKGAVIASTQAAVDAGNNRLTTQTLTTSDIENQAEYQADSASLSIGYSSGGNGVGKDPQGNATAGSGQTPNSTLASLNGFSATAPLALSAEGQSESTTQSAISGGQVTITDDSAQQTQTGQSAEQTLAGLNRDTSNTQNSLTPIFNEQEIRAGFEIVGAFSREAGTFLGNRAKESADAQKILDQEMEKPEGQRDPALIEQATQTLQQNAIWGMGGTGRIVLTAVTAAASGNVTGSGAEFLQAATVNALQSLGAQQLKQLADQLGGEGSPAHTALHAVLGCAGAAAQGGSCGTGAMAASAGVVINKLLDGVEGKESQGLNAEEKEARANLLTTLVTGITAAAGGDTAVANTAARIESENNALTLTQAKHLGEELQSCPPNDWGCIGPKIESAKELADKQGGVSKEKAEALDERANKIVANMTDLCTVDTASGCANFVYTEAMKARMLCDTEECFQDAETSLRIAIAANSRTGFQTLLTQAVHDFGWLLGVRGGAAPKVVEGGVGANNGALAAADGTANAATYPLLKNQLAVENLANIAAQDARLAKAVAGEAGIGSGTAAEADQLGRIWVGDGARLAKDQVNCPGCLWSADGTRFYRPPTLKPNTPAEYSPTGVQANFEQWANGKKISNGHLVVTP